MIARGFRSIGRQWTEVSADIPTHNHLTYLVDDDDQADELAQRRGRRPARPIPAVTVSPGETE